MLIFAPHNECMEDLKVSLKEQIIESLNLQGMRPEDIDDNAPLFGEGLGLDSIDSLELMVLLERNYGIKIEDAREGRKVLTSVQTMAEYIQANQQKAGPNL
jgi:acyl carrier protein